MSTCALVGAADFNAPYFLKQKEVGCFDAIIAIDYGYAHLQSIGVEPHYVVGDFDSLGYVPKREGVFAYNPEKDDSDFALALNLASSLGAEVVFAYGVTGQRLDHTLAALEVAASFAEGGRKVTLVSPTELVDFLVGPASMDLPAGEGVVSVFSLTPESTGVTEVHLKYEISQYTLKNRTSLGLSNELIGVPASVSLSAGTILVFHPLA